MALVGALGYLWFSPSCLKSAPNVTLERIDGHRRALTQYRGHPLLVTFWATTCPGCVQEMPHLVQLYNDLEPKGFQIVAVAMSYDVLKQVQIMAQERHLPYTVAIDTDGSAQQSPGVGFPVPTDLVKPPLHTLEAGGQVGGHPRVSVEEEEELTAGGPGAQVLSPSDPRTGFLDEPKRDRGMLGRIGPHHIGGAVATGVGHHDDLDPLARHRLGGRRVDRRPHQGHG